MKRVFGGRAQYVTLPNPDNSVRLMCQKIGSGDVDFQDLAVAVFRILHLRRRNGWRTRTGPKHRRETGDEAYWVKKKASVAKPPADPFSGRTTPIISPGSPGWETIFGNTGNRGTGRRRRRRNNPYADLINNLMNQGRADIRAESVADAASRDAAHPPAPHLLRGDSRPRPASGSRARRRASSAASSTSAPAQLAAQNTAEGTSVKARLDAANAEAQAVIPQARLPAGGCCARERRATSSGKQGMADKQARFDTLNEMLGNVESAVGGYAANERQRQRQLADLEMQAAQRQWEIWNATQMMGGDAGDEPTSGRGGQAAPNNNGPYGGVPTGAEVVYDPQRGTLVKFGGEQVGYIDVNGHYRPLFPT